MKIELGKSERGPFTMPVDLVTQTVAIVGMRGSGKTNTADVIAEGLLGAGQQVAIIDPLDVWWGLRSSHDGKADGFPVVVIGGEHADIPLEAGAGKAVADFVTDHRANIVISTRHLSKTKQRTFVADFAEHLYERKGKGEFKTPLQVIIDEADAFAPQRIEGDTARCFGAIDDLVRRGRSSGFGVTVITQRPAVLHKDILTQVEMLVVHRIVSPQDRKAIEAWVEVHDAEGVAAKVLGSLHTLKRGEAWIWSPSWMGVLERVQVNARSTFDSSYTPKVGEVKSGPKKIAPVDMDALKKAMGDTLEKAKANDPAELKRKIADLERQLKAIPEAVATKEVEKRVEVPALKEAEIVRIEKVVEKLRIVSVSAEGTSADILAALKAFTGRMAEVNRPKALRGFGKQPLGESVAAARPRLQAKPTTQPGDYGNHLAKGERAVLTAAAQYPEGVERNQISILTGYKRYTRDTYLQRLSEKGFVAEQAGGLIGATDDGVAALGDFEPLPTGRELYEYWIARLPEGERRILELLATCDAPEDCEREAITEATGYKRSTRDTYLQRMIAKKIVIDSGRGIVRAADILFDGGAA